MEKSIQVGKNLFANMKNFYEKTQEEQELIKKQVKDEIYFAETIFNECYDKIVTFLKKYNVDKITKRDLTPVFYLEYRDILDTRDGQFFDNVNHIVLYRKSKATKDDKTYIIDNFKNLHRLKLTCTHEMLHMFFSDIIKDDKNDKMAKNTITGLKTPITYINEQFFKGQTEKTERLRMLDENITEYLAHIILDLDPIEHKIKDAEKLCNIPIKNMLLAMTNHNEQFLYEKPYEV